MGKACSTYGEKLGVYGFLVGKTEGKRPLGKPRRRCKDNINTLIAELNPICHLLALLGAHHILHVSRIRFKRQVKSHLPSAGIIRSSPYSPR